MAPRRRKYATGGQAGKKDKGRKKATEGKEKPIPRKRKRPLAAADLLKLVETSLDDDKAENVIVIDLAGKTDIADYMVIASGASQRQVVAMADHLQEKLKAGGYQGISVEGAAQGDWVLIDAFDVVVHLFRPEVRQFYDLEKLWNAPAAGVAGRAD